MTSGMFNNKKRITGKETDERRKREGVMGQNGGAGSPILPCGGASGYSWAEGGVGLYCHKCPEADLAKNN